MATLSDADRGLPQAQAYLDVSPRAARLIVVKLEELGIVSEVTGRARNRVYLATGILDLIREP